MLHIAYLGHVDAQVSPHINRLNNHAPDFNSLRPSSSMPMANVRQPLNHWTRYPPRRKIKDASKLKSWLLSCCMYLKSRVRAGPNMVIMASCRSTRTPNLSACSPSPCQHLDPVQMGRKPPGQAYFQHHRLAKMLCTFSLSRGTGQLPGWRCKTRAPMLGSTSVKGQGYSAAMLAAPALRRCMSLPTVDCSQFGVGTVSCIKTPLQKDTRKNVNESGSASLQLSAAQGRTHALQSQNSRCSLSKRRQLLPLVKCLAGYGN